MPPTSLWRVAGRPPERARAGRLLLQRWRAADLAPLWGAIECSLEHLRPWMAWAGAADRASTRAFLRDSHAAWERGEQFEYAIRSADGTILGGIGLMTSIARGGLEIGYWVHAEHTRRGVATLSAAALAEAAFGLVEVLLVEIHHDEANVASGGVPRRLGFQRVRTVDAPRATPGESGREVQWQMTLAAFAESPARQLLQGARARGGCGLSG